MEGMFQSLRERATNLFSRLRGPPAPISSSGSHPCSACCPIVEGMKKLNKMMEMIHRVLYDTEEMEVRDDHVKLWLNDLTDVVYDIEDLVEEIECALMQNRTSPDKADQDEAQTTHEVSDSLVTPCCAPLHDASFQRQIRDQIRSINDEFDTIYEFRRKLALRPEDGEKRRASPLKTPSSSLVDEQCVKCVNGREDDMREVIHRLRSDDDEEGRHSNERVRVVSIVGMCGVGKTTLAKLVFRDDAVVNHFEKTLWVYVSETFDAAQLTNQILGALGVRSSELESFNSLSEILRGELQGKRFLLVLDDVWNERQEPWDALWCCFSGGAEGSRVLITTRSEQVSRISGASEGNMYHLECLSPVVCWSLFERRAFRGGRSDVHRHLVSTGKQIVEKCKGLPLTVKMLAGLLVGQSSEEWDNILRSDLWDLLEVKDHILLSYHRLPSPIKPCFAYCAIFPKGHEFERKNLVLLWMAQGFVASTSTRLMEDIGREHLQYLVQRSFFQRLGGDRFQMHDLIHDLALSVSAGDCSKFEGYKIYSIISKKARHLYFEGDQAAIGRLQDTNLQHLRTFYMVRKSLRGALDLDGMFLHMKYLRVLYLCDDEIMELPDSIGNLKLLRYLGISGRQLRALPESVGHLPNLQTLVVKRACSLRVLPKFPNGRLNLRHFEIQRS